MISIVDIENETDKLRRQHEVADAILYEVARNPRPFTTSEITLLQAVGFTEQPEIKREIGRLQGVQRFQERAGTELEREALQTKVEAATKKRDEQLPTLRAELEETVRKLQAKIDALEAAVAVPQKELDERLKAVEAMRATTMLPRFLRDAFNVRKSMTKNSYDTLVQAEADIKTIQSRMEVLAVLTDEVLNRAVPRRVHSEDPLRAAYSLAEELQMIDTTDTDRRVNREVITKWRADAKARAAELQTIIKEQAPQRDGDLAEVDKIRNFYVR
ncbi:MAG: hypothetical protein R3C20_00240 [Planctomycetaceae bacterium]